ncbi:hypothetical protein [Flavobacterium amniphilum]|uniref:hypothetical protein n=1 Tax=Flavobacterium amniphilum TaxID=1834035 RepID=UPI00202A1BEE|nr:hypothetical protein [Flavobacterium amniphilum]
MNMKKFDLHNDPKIESGFRIPDDYFDSFENRIMQQVLAEEKETKVIAVWQRQSFWISSVAAVFVLSFGIWMYFVQNNAETTLSTSDYLAYESDLTTEDIATHLTDEDIASIENEMNLYDAATETYINEYLN